MLFSILRPGPHVLKVQAYNRKTDVAFVKRGFVVNSDPNFCSLVLVNRGVTISEDGTRAVVQVRLYGPATYLSCVLDGEFHFICKCCCNESTQKRMSEIPVMSMISVGTIPVELSALTRGQHELLISPVGCSGGNKTLSVNFST